MNNANKIEPGTTYMHNGIPVVALAKSSRDSDRALFVSTEYWPTPFVVWTYSLLSDNDIDLERGEYFFTLDEALQSIR